MKALFIYTVIFCIPTLAWSQEKYSLEDILKRTFNEAHYNQWVLINESGEESDTLRISEGFLNDTSFVEYQDLSSVIMTKKYLVLVDELDKVLYLMPKGKNIERHKIHIADSLAPYFEHVNEDTMGIERVSDDTYIYYDSDGNKITLIVNHIEGRLISYSTSIKEANEDNIPQIKEIKYVLINGMNSDNGIRDRINPANFVQISNNIFSVNPRFLKYEFINMIIN